MTLTLTNPKTVSAMLEEEGIKLSHALGQNFLVNGAIIDKILKLAEANEADNILEVGPGIGALTVPLLETGAKVVSIEKDPRLKSLLLKSTDFANEHFTLIEGDAVEFTNPYSLIPSPCERETISECNKLVANLPYNIAATLVLNVFQNKEGIESATVMVQKEVADRMKAQVGTKNYGAYTVKLSLFAEECGSFFVGRNNFMPAPRVDSSVIRLNRINRGLPRAVLQNACLLADAAFFNRRKTILNSCKAFFASQGLRFAINEDIEGWLRSCNVNPKTRGERLTTQDFINLAEKFS